MPLLQWDPKYRLKIGDMDRRNEKLFSLLGELNDALAKGQGHAQVGQILTNLVHYSIYHVAQEEMLLRKFHLDGNEDEHFAAHADLLQQVRSLKQRFDAGKAHLTADTLTSWAAWLDRHILGYDKSFAPALLAKGVR